MRSYEIERIPAGLQVQMHRIENLSLPDAKKVISLITYDGRFDPQVITKAAGRNLWFPLRKPLTGGYDTIQASGVGFIDIGVRGNDGESIVLIDQTKPKPRIRAPQPETGLFTHITTVIADGQPVDIRQESPFGAYTEALARQKYQHTQEAFALSVTRQVPFLTPFPVTRVIYRDIPDGADGRQSAIIFVCPTGGLRAEDLLGFIINLGQTKGPEPAMTYMLTHFLPIMQLLGESARALHHLGKCHYQLTLGNVSLLLENKVGRRRVCIYDWETFRPVDRTDPALARAYDMGVSISSFGAVLHEIQNHIHAPRLTAIAAWNGLLAYLCGYTGQDTRQIHAALDPTPEMIADLTFGSPQDTVDLITRKVYQLPFFPRYPKSS